jgi:uncharacterized protein (UPF0333 family)
MDYKKGFTLLTALLMVLFVSLAMAVIGTAFLKSTQIGHGIKVFKTTKDAAESSAYAVMEEIKNGNLELKGNCTPTNTDSCSKYSDCEIVLPPDIEAAIKKASGIEDVKAYLLSNCTDSSGLQIYTIQIEANATTGARTTIYFIYRK